MFLDRFRGGLFFAARRFRYEFHALRDDRWQIVGALDDGRQDPSQPFGEQEMEALETRARHLARKYLNQPGTKSVKVLRERVRSGGDSVASEFLVLTAPDDKDRPISVGRTTPPTQGGCRHPDDLLSRPASVVIGAVLRGLLDRIVATPLELLCDERWQRTLDGHANVVWLAILTVAEQDDPLRIGRKRRAAELEALLNAQRARQQSAAARRDAPALSDNDLPALIAGADRHPPDDRRFLVFRAVSRTMRETQSWLGRIELLLDLANGGPDSDRPAEADQIVDTFMAGTLDSPLAVKDLLPGSAELGQALVDLAHLVDGDAPERASPQADRLARLLGAGRLPETSACLVDRITRSLKSAQPLSRGDEHEEWRYLDLLERAVPAFMAETIEPGLARRRENVRVSLLETASRPDGPPRPNAAARNALSRR